jgi:hypothetical protein
MPSPFPGMDPYLEGRQIWPRVHARLIVAMADYLTPLVEPAYYVEIEERVYISRVTPEGEKLIHPDVAVLGPPEPASSAGGLAVATAAAVETQTVTLPLYEQIRESYLEIRTLEGEELITSIELLSPTNKRPGPGRREYEAKRRHVLQSWTNLVEVDLLRAGRPMEMQPSPASDYRILVLTAREYPRAQLLAFNLPQPIPAVPIPLREGEAPVPLPLGRLLNEVYDRARYGRRIRYDGLPPEPPLAPETAAWLDALLRGKDLRSG